MVDPTLYITQNTPYINTITVRNKLGEPVNLSNYTSMMRISKWYGSKTVYNINTAITYPSEGIVRISINSIGTGMLDAGTMVYSLFLRPPGIDSDKHIILKGTVVVIPSVGYTTPA